MYCTIEDFIEEGIKQKWMSRTFIASIYKGIQNWIPVIVKLTIYSWFSQVAKNYKTDNR
jgi:hypothetical protein